MKAHKIEILGPINKAVLVPGAFIHSCIVYGCYCPGVAGWIVATETKCPRCLNYLFSSSLQKKFAEISFR